MLVLALLPPLLASHGPHGAPGGAAGRGVEDAFAQAKLLGHTFRGACAVVFNISFAAQFACIELLFPKPPAKCTINDHDVLCTIQCILPSIETECPRFVENLPREVPEVFCTWEMSTPARD